MKLDYTADNDNGVDCKKNVWRTPVVTVTPRLLHVHVYHHLNFSDVNDSLGACVSTQFGTSGIELEIRAHLPVEIYELPPIDAQSLATVNVVLHEGRGRIVVDSSGFSWLKHNQQ